MVNIESLACGTPVVASNVGAVSEVVRDHENGILVPPRDPFKLAEALQYLLDNEDTRLKFGKQGVKWIHENFSSEAVITRLIEIYRTLQ
jgi:glycosyltransferase involved in cell wall biosynthesis